MPLPDNLVKELLAAIEKDGMSHSDIFSCKEVCGVTDKYGFFDFGSEGSTLQRFAGLYKSTGTFARKKKLQAKQKAETKQSH